jgi:hypothetical protein
VWKYPDIRRSKKYIKVKFLWFYISILFQHFIRKKIFHLFLFICLLLSDLKFLFNCPFCILLVWFVNYTLCQLFLSFSIKPINAIYIYGKLNIFIFYFVFLVHNILDFVFLYVIYLFIGKESVCKKREFTGWLKWGYNRKITCKNILP